MQSRLVRALRALLHAAHHVAAALVDRPQKKLASGTNTLDEQSLSSGQERLSSYFAIDRTRTTKVPIKEPSVHLLLHGKPRRHDVRRILLVVQNDGVGPDVLEQ